MASSLLKATRSSESVENGKPVLVARPSQQGTLTVVVVGQIPPPVNGQSIMISEFLNGAYSNLHLVHVPMSFSRSTSEIGSFGFRKLAHLVHILISIWIARLRTGAAILYYPPAGANLVPVLRDFALLIPTRWLFRRTVFHFHAAGLYSIYPRLSLMLRPLFRLAYNRPDLAIFTTAATSSEAAHLHARATAIIPCGIRDVASEYGLKKTRIENAGIAATPTILFAGILCEGKGILTLLEACRILRDAGTPFRLVCMGAFQQSSFEKEVRTTIRISNLESQVSFPGVLTGAEKHHAFATADIFCFPSHYPAESFGVVLIEAMSYELPIVATKWQGIPEVTGDEGGAHLAPIQDPPALAALLHLLLISPQLRASMGKINRRRYIERYTLTAYRNSLEHHLRLTGSFSTHDRSAIS